MISCFTVVGPRADAPRATVKAQRLFSGRRCVALWTALAAIARTNQTALIGVRLLIEPFLTVPEIARILRVDRHTVCRLFADEPGVVVIGNR